MTYYRRTSRQRYSNRNSAAPGWLWLLVGITLGVLITGGFFTKLRPLSSKITVASHQQHSKLDQPHHPSTKKVALDKKSQQFDFYTILSNEPEGKIKQEKKTPSPEKLAPPIPLHYVVQAASLKSTTEADQLKAQLSLLGFDVFITDLQKGNKDWHRVNVGPFTNEHEAEKAQKRLKEINISTLLLKTPY